MVHDKIKDVKCVQCDYACSQNGNLKQHIKQVHDKIKDVKCDLCDYVCSQNSTLKKHLKICTGKLNMSGGELVVMKTLELLNIKFEREVCALPNSRLRFDFEIYVNGETKYIEYDGIQHYKPVCFGGMSQENAEEAFQKLQRHDKIKNDWCEKNNFELLRISYLDFENIYMLIDAWV